MGYLTELRDQWRPLTCAMIGLSSGYSLAQYTTSIIAPPMITELGWSRADFASVGSLGIVAVVALPIVGRITDMIGVRLTALIGVVVMPIAFIGMSMMTSDIKQYIAWYVVLAMLGITTTTTVYSRLVVQNIKNSRGLALAIVASGPAIMGAIGGPLLNHLVETQGWRSGFIALAVLAAAGGALALTMMPSEKKDPATAPRARPPLADYKAIFRNPAFWVIFVSMLLVNFPQVIALTQLKLVLLEQGITAEGTSVMFSAFAVGVLAGRFLAGLALDRLPAHLVAAVGLGVPGTGLFLMASSLDAPTVLTLATFLFGFSFGAEGDIVGFVVVRTFGVSVYSSVMGLETLAMSLASSGGSIVCGVLLATTGSFTLFLTISGFAVCAGGAMFLLLRKSKEPIAPETVQLQSP